MESLKSIATNIIPEIVTTISEHAQYPFQVDNNISDLGSAIRDLVARKNDVKTELEISERKNGAPTNQVEEWLSKVEDVEKEVEEIQENNRKRRRSIWSDYTTSKSALKKLREVKNLYDQKTTLDVSVHLPPPLAKEMPASSAVSKNLKLALQYIKDDRHGIIGIWGMGGVGKTHLLKQINNEISKDHAFNVIIFVTCSKECTEEKIQNEIISKLDLQKCDVIEQNQSTIHNFLSQHSFLLLLDDLWNRVDLETIGIPNLMSKRKVVLTTRSTEVCGVMEVRKKIEVEVLNEDDAWSLFKEKVTEETINSNPLIQQHARKVMKELGRLPLALITIGRAMYDKVDPNEWEQAVVLLKQARIHDVEFSDSHCRIFHTLRFSYDSLKNETLKQCFLHCSLWPEDSLIYKNKLVELWMGLGLINESDINMAYINGYCNIRRLRAVCLLEETDDGDRIKMHDVIRDMALWISSNQGVEKYKWFVHGGPYEKNHVMEVQHDTEKLSLTLANYSFTPPKEVSFSISGSSTKLSTLLLTKHHLTDPKSFRLELFGELKVLDLSGNWFKCFPVEICTLVHLQFLNLSDNYCLEATIPRKLENLINLKYLLLRRSLQCTIPIGVLSKLKALRVFDINRYRHPLWSKEDNLGNFSSLAKELQSLPEFQAVGINIYNMHDFQKLSETSSVPVRWLSVREMNEEGCLSFTSCFLGNSQLQNNLTHLDITKSSFGSVEFEGTSDDQINCHLGRLVKISFYNMQNLESVVWKGLDPTAVFPRLQILHFIFCHQLKSISWIIYLPCIQELEVCSCRSIKQLISSDELNNGGFMASQPYFSFLRKMSLHENHELESISDPMIITFPSLESLEILRCNKLKKLPFKTGNPPKRLQFVGTEEWWNNIEMEDSCHRSLLRPSFKYI
jgi:disease resistance protein RPS2